MGAVDELVDQHEGAGRQIFLERTAGRERDEVGDAGALEHVDIGAVVDVGGRQAMALAVARQEHHRQAGDVADAQRRRRLSPRALDAPLDDVGEAGQIVDAGTTDNAEHGRGHRPPRIWISIYDDVGLGSGPGAASLGAWTSCQIFFLVK